MSTVNVGVVGVGNCVSSMVQGVTHYTAAPDAPGLAHPVCAGYAIADIRFTAAFDVDTAKIGRDLAEAIRVAPNNSTRFAEVPSLGVPVAEGILSDGVGRGTGQRITARGAATVESVAEHLKLTRTQVLVNFVPAGSQQASELYAEAALSAGCAFVNCLPSVIARSPRWVERFAAAGLPLLGDDLKSQFGATLVHRALVELLAANGVRLRNTYQLLAGGNMDFVNLQDAERMRTKKDSKASGLRGADGSALLPPESVHVGADYIPFLADRKLAMIRVEGEGFGGTPVELDLRLSVDDSPSGAGNALDAVRYLKFALDHGISGLLDPVAARLMKAVPRPMSEEAAAAGLRDLLTLRQD
ncbi:myo-inositol-1-phosphate synthase [Kitasatospora sp. GAS204A]|uniref:inositol-3-phosphate synthase n=1 Tax=unclassified Kitasatospora TaxID=2633591 RepID=UPI002475CFBA|nr:inositol-3-phosphate synthase [Kitasatospora sp. GAS204B]MDH6118381.1 myo-inositol-1-phosphate synthase [Kitasatospora sp. GAS204B]